MIHVKYPRGEAVIDIVLFLHNHRMNDVFYLYRHMFAICDNLDQVRNELRKDADKYWRSLSPKQKQSHKEQLYKNRLKRLMDLIREEAI